MRFLVRLLLTNQPPILLWPQINKPKLTTLATNDEYELNNDDRTTFSHEAMKRKRTFTEYAPDIVDRQQLGCDEIEFPLDVAKPSLSATNSALWRQYKPALPTATSFTSSGAYGHHREDKRTYTLGTEEEPPILPLLRRSRSLPTFPDLRCMPHVAPLSRRNLHAMNDRSRYPMTPDKSATLTPSTSYKPQSDTSPSKSSSRSSSTKDPGAKMEWIHIMGEEAGLAELRRRLAFREAVMEIVDGKRDSAMKPASAQRFRTVLNKMKRRNETSVSARLMPFLVKDDHIVPGTQPGESRAFQDDFLDWNLDADFRSASVPVPANMAHVHDVDKAFGVKNPRPDVVFGFDADAFSTEELRLFNRFDPELSKGIVSPFFAIQWKGAKGTTNDEKIQVRRDGAAMVCARRKARLVTGGFRRFEDASGLNSPPFDSIIEPEANVNPDTTNDDIDLDTIVFSAAITPDIAFFYVHWALEADGKVTWHMAVVKKFFMDDDDVPRIRVAMHNIIDWNLQHRLAALKGEVEVYRQIDEGKAEEARGAVGTGKRRRVE